MYNLRGDLVATHLIANGTRGIEISTAGWAKGVYLCELEVGGKTVQTGKIVVE